MNLMKLFDLDDLPGPHPDCPDPVHNERVLWLGIDVAERFLGFSLEDIILVFRHSRPAATSCRAEYSRRFREALPRSLFR
jgi:hypothetical protein